MTQNQTVVGTKDSGVREGQINSDFINKSISNTKKGSLISIVIPLYNEQNTIKEVIKRIPNHQQYEIIVVDDGSTDNSVKCVKEINNRKIKMISHEKNQGYGAALLTGFKNATGDVIVTIDSDGQHNPEEIPALTKPIINDHADMVIGSRYLGYSSYKVPLHTRLGEYLVGIFLWFLFQQRVHNNQNGFRAFSYPALKIFKNARDNSFGFCTETLFNAAYNGLRISEIPIKVNVRKHGNSHIDLFKIFFSISFCILIYVIKRFKLNRFMSNLLLDRMKMKITVILNKLTEL